MARYVSGVILAILVILLLVFAPVRFCLGVVIALSFIAGWEFFRMIGESFMIRGIGSAFCAVGAAKIMAMTPNASFLIGFLYAAVAFAFVSHLFGDSQDNRARAGGVAFTLLGVIYIATGFGFLAKLFLVPENLFWIFFTLVATFLGDTGAYFAGRFFGGKKLAPAISPAKTVAGFYGALVGGAFGAAVVWMIFNPMLSSVKIVPLGAVVAAIGAVGDLCESLIKRSFEVKDSGALIPGHGGLLDRVDGLLFSAPFVFLAREWLL